MNQWYKGNIHSHTRNSDGMWSVAQAVESYYQKGYSFLCLTDHNLYTDYRKEFGKEDFLILPGVEAEAALFDCDGQVVCLHHMNGILGTEEMQKKASDGVYSHMEYIEPDKYYETWNGRESGEKLAQKLKRHGCIVTYNHPIWSRVKPEEFVENSKIDIVEIYNYNTVNESGTGYDVTYWDLMLRNGYRVNAVASDDNHNSGQFLDSFGGFIMVKAEKLTHDAICEAIMKGDYYSSSGPELYRWEIKNNRLEVESSPVKNINFIVGGAVGMGLTCFGNKGEKITRAEYPISGNEKYIRIECEDGRGRTAWTNPIYF